ncbi:MAG: hypothetical protein QM813_24855 [Verrucomicrobiota bacterium]
MRSSSSPTTANFSNSLINHTVEIRMSKLLRYRGNYDSDPTA